MNRSSALKMGFLLTVLVSLVSVFNASGQSIWTNPITGTSPGLTSPYTTGDVADPSITVSGISRGAGIAGNAGNDRYNANGWNTAAIDLTAYFEFTLTPDPGCEIDFVSFVYTSQRSNASIANFAFRSSLDGFTANIGAPDFDGITIDLSAPAYQNITASITFRFYAWGASDVGNTFSINDFTFNGVVDCGGCGGLVPQPTTETTADIATPSCTSALISWTASTTADNVIVVVSTGAIGSTPTDGTAYTASTTFGSGETIGAGQFVVYNGSGTSVTITGLTPGTTYNYAIFGYDGVVADCEENYLTGGNFGSFTTLVSCGTAEITTLMVNSCNGTAEGTDELIIIENGDEAINIDDMVIDLPNSTWCNSGCGPNTIVNNATYLADLNAMAGCVPDLFVFADPIPAGETIIIFTGNPPSTVLDYSANCGAPGAPIYAIFLNNLSTTGNFANSGGAPRTIEIDFGNGQSDIVTYLPDDVDPNDGGSVLFDAAGNPTYYTSTDCVYPLSLRMTSFIAVPSENQVLLEWTVRSDENNVHFLVQRSIDGISFQTIGEVTGNSAQSFSFLDHQPPNSKLFYYRLALADQNGTITYSGMISVSLDRFGAYFAEDQIVVMSDYFSSEPIHYFVYAMNGKLMDQGTLSHTGIIPFHHQGTFVLDIPDLKIRQKIVAF